jgi:hypothetical protein
MPDSEGFCTGHGIYVGHVALHFVCETPQQSDRRITRPCSGSDHPIYNIQLQVSTNAIAALMERKHRHMILKT